MKKNTKIKLKDIVCTLEQAEKLRELGVPQDSLFYWFPNPNLEEIKKKYKLPDYNVLDGNEVLKKQSKNIRGLVLDGSFQETYSAFTIQELRELLNYNIIRSTKAQLYIGECFIKMLLALKNEK